MNKTLLKIERNTKPDWEQPIIETIEGVDRIKGYRTTTTYKVMQDSLCLFQSQLLGEVIKYIQELNFEASLLLLNLRTEEIDAR